MLKTVPISANRKTGPIAVTYRSGMHETYGTCPTSCALHPKSETGSCQVDADYLAALSDAVPLRGQAWTYSHFAAEALPLPKEGKTVINASCDTLAEAVRTVELGRPAVYAAPLSQAGDFPLVNRGVRFVRCPAELSEGFTCAQCGGGRPLCARGERDYVVVFVAHGTGAKKVGTDQKGGCYAASGPTAIQWHGVKKKGAANDAQALREFARSLPPGSLLRHHVAGDIGRELGA
jgi:hypothetical protein